ncbi:hypothetical protein ACIBK8_09355 [Streptomyces sp. NPDC050161]
MWTGGRWYPRGRSPHA